MGFFSGLKEAKTYDRGVWFSPGTYLLKIKKIIVKDTRKSGQGFIVEAEVVESSNVKDHPVGSNGTWFQSMLDKDVAFGEIKGFCYAAMGLDKTRDKEEIKTDVDPNIETIMTEALDSSCPDGKNGFDGDLVRLQVVMVKTKKEKDFSRHQWYPAKDTEAPKS